MDETKPINVEDENADTESLRCASLEVAGIIEDSEGNKWAIPADNVDELDDLKDLSPFGRLDLDERFHYQTEHQDRVPIKQTEGFVPVTRKEVGLPPVFTATTGHPVSDVVHIMDTVLVKIPKVLNERIQRRKKKLAKDLLQDTEPTEEMLKRSARDGSPIVKSVNAALEAVESDGGAAKQERVSKESPYLTR